jgi:type VI secretion system protein ImpM
MTFPVSHKVNFAYFGKIPSRGDFVRNPNHSQLITHLDAWASGAMGQLSRDSHWKTLYDNSAPLSFAFLGSHSKLAIAGRLHPSQDSSSRRFPFLCATSVPVANAMTFMAHSPLVFKPVWHTMAQKSDAIVTALDPELQLQDLDLFTDEIQMDVSKAFDAFFETKTIADMEGLLHDQEHPHNFHNMVVMLGILLEPLLVSKTLQIKQGLLLPLPSDPYYVATFWLSLIAPFLSKGDFEIAVFIGDMNNRPQLAIGFRGAHPDELGSLLSAPEQLTQTYISLDDSAWVTDRIKYHAGLYKLSSYLQQPGLSLRILYNTFLEVFTGA